MADINSVNMESHRALDIQQRNLVFEINYVLPDNKPRIVSVEDSFAVLGISDVAVSGEIAEFNISAQVELIYNALAVSEEEEHLFGTACKFSKAFKETSDIERLSSEDYVNAYSLNITVDKVETMLISDRKVNVKIYATLNSKANMCYRVDCAESFDDLDIVCKNKNVFGTKSMGLKRVQSYINEDVELDQTLPEIDNILCKNVSVQIENKKVTDGKIIFYGTAHVDIAFSAKSDNGNFFATGFDINFNQACEFEKLSESAQNNITYSVSDVGLDVKSNGIITVEMIISFDVEAFDCYEYTIMEDAFLPGANTEVNKCNLSFENNTIVTENVGICSDKLYVENGDIDKILISFAEVKDCNAYIKDKNIYFDGIYSVKAVYVPQSDPNTVKIAEAQVPFVYMSQSQIEGDCSVTGGVCIKSVTAQKNDYGEIVVKWVADISAVVTEVTEDQVVQSLNITEIQTLSERNIYYHFIGENETVWDVAKRFGVPPMQICELNNIKQDDNISQLKGVVVMINRGEKSNA